MRRFLLVGLTGGIATGKSTVSAMFRNLGCAIIDADQLARDVVEPGEPALREIVAEFGPGVLRPDGTLDRPALGAIVFGDSTRRRRLEEITHPAIRERFTRRVAELVEAGFTGVALFDAAVIVESGGYKTLDGLVVVVTDEETELARLMARDKIGREDAVRKIRSQMPVAEKARLADHVIDNTGDRSATEAQVRAVYAALLERRRRMGSPTS
jgi:dephospho-CoA kinase